MQGCGIFISRVKNIIFRRDEFSMNNLKRENCMAVENFKHSFTLKSNSLNRKKTSKKEKETIK